MTGNNRLYLVLILMGAAWGLVFTVIKVAVSTGHQPFGILLWQSLIGVALSAVILLFRGKSLALSRRYFWLYFGVAVLGTVFPNYFSNLAAAQLPAGIMVIIVALVPLFAMPVALLMGYEKLSYIRLSGILFGALAVGLLVGPKASLPEPEKVFYVVLAILMPLAYGVEGNFLMWFGQRAPEPLPDPVQILYGASLVGLILAVPLALLSGQFINPIRVWGLPEYAIVAASMINWIAYVGYVWLIGRAGPVFAAQVAYLVTGFGVIWAMLLLGETYSVYIWAALGLMMVGLLLVQPRDNAENLGDDVGEQKQA